jgi:hypothetical protein
VRTTAVKINLVLLQLRAIASIGVAGFIVLKARGYLQTWGLSVNPNLYAVGAIAFFWLVQALSMKPVIREFKVIGDARKQRRLDDQQRVHND